MIFPYAKRMETTPRSFIREILKLTTEPEIISFAGGLPNPSLFEIEGIKKAAYDVLNEEGMHALQYSTTEGYRPLREFISGRYKERLGLTIDPDEILITNGSQQCLDLIGKVFIDKNSNVAIEKPGYLGAIQAFSLFEPVFHTVTLNNDGPDTEELSYIQKKYSPRLFYTIPNSQNPSGITYSTGKREEIASIIKGSNTVIIEDDAYGELRFFGNQKKPLKAILYNETVLCGSFSKVVSPGMRIGWISAVPEVLDKIVIAKQATDLHSNFLSQMIIYKYLSTNSLSDHMIKVNKTYRRHCELMRSCIFDLFPDNVICTNPDGGMFLWLTLPEGLDSMELFRKAILQKVAILPGYPFYTDGGGFNTVRLNFSHSTEEKIMEGISRLARVFNEMSKGKK